MKKFIVLSSLIFQFIIGFSQNYLVAYEYWLDGDYTNKVVLSITPTQNYQLIENVNMASQTTGLHAFQARFKQSDGLWSNVMRKLFIIPLAHPETDNQLNAYEYWFDNEYAEKVFYIVNATQSLILVDDIDMESFYVGLHAFHIRFRQSNGLWSSVMTQFFVIPLHHPEKDNQLNAYEYWLDGNYSEKVFSPINQTESFHLLSDLNIEEFSTGLHSFHIRFRQTNNEWSSALTKFFIKYNRNPNAQDSKIVAYKYWYDQDFNNAISEELPTPINPYELTLQIDLESLNVGLHNISTQFRDNNDLWSSVLSEPFYRGELTTFSLKVFLEGPFSGTEMSTDLNPAYIPLSQPYSQTPFNYPGTENVTAIPDADIVDWVLIELRDTLQAVLATEETRITRCAAFIKNDGTIVGMDGLENIKLYVTIEDNLYAVILHRNHLGIMSSSSLTQTGGVYTYDFSTGFDKVYGGSLGYKQLGTGIWGMPTGDSDANGIIDIQDKQNIWSAQAGESGYKSGDVNLNGEVDNADKDDKILPNIGKESQVPE
jgi:hypothetical protein